MTDRSEHRPVVLVILDYDNAENPTFVWPGANARSVNEYRDQCNAYAAAVRDTGGQVYIQVVDADKYFKWCRLSNMVEDPTTQQANIAYPKDPNIAYPYDGNLTALLVMHSMGLDMAQALITLQQSDEADQYALQLDKVDETSEDLMQHVLLHAVGRRGSLELRIRRYVSTTPLEEMPERTTWIVQVALVQGIPHSRYDSVVQTFLTGVKLGSLTGGRINLHIYDDINAHIVYSTTFWLPWGRGLSTIH